MMNPAGGIPPRQNVANVDPTVITKVRGWRNDPCCVHNKAHTDRWDRVLLALGETVADNSLAPMTAAEAQTYASRGWSRWVEIVQVLKLVEAAPVSENPNIQPPVQQSPPPPPVVAVPPPEILAKRSFGREGQPAMRFIVRLSKPPQKPVTVNYTTRKGQGWWQYKALPAEPGSDYVETRGTLTFAAGRSIQTITVPLLDDAIDEGPEYFWLRFSQARGATLSEENRETVGLIVNSDPVQQMWLARFGRTVGSQVTDAVSDRLGSGLAPGARATLAGQSLDLSQADDGKALTDALTGLAQRFGARAPAANDEDPFAPTRGPSAAATAPAPTGRDLLLGSSFHVAPERDGSGPGLAVWGRVAHGRFDGEEASDGGRMRIDGQWVVTGTLGADADWGRLLAGVAVSLSEGEGTFAQPGVDKGSVESTLTTVSPYARFRITDRVSAWGLAGWGTGSMTVVQDALPADPDAGRDQPRPRTETKADISMRLGALGARGELLTPGTNGGMDLALKTDAFFVRTESEKAANSAATTADAGRVRLVLEGGRAFDMGDGASFRPSLELGVRHDGGDAETGAGVEVSGGVAYNDAASGLSIEAKARMLAAHADSDYEEWGASATARLDPGARGRGLSFSLAPTIGATSSASERLWGARDARAFAPGGEFEASRGLTAEAGYGMALFGDRFTGTPNLGFGTSDGGARDYRLGWRLTSAVRGDPGFEVNLDATRREAANPGSGAGAGSRAEHGAMLRALVRW